jgi:hypothetical protein
MADHDAGATIPHKESLAAFKICHRQDGMALTEKRLPLRTQPETCLRSEDGADGDEPHHVEDVVEPLRRKSAAQHDENRAGRERAGQNTEGHQADGPIAPQPKRRDQGSRLLMPGFPTARGKRT